MSVDKMASSTWFFIRHYIIPSVFVFGVPVFGLCLALSPRPGGLLSNLEWSLVIGDGFSWTLVIGFISWAVASLRIPSKVFHGPTTSFGCTPVYSANGFQYYCVTVLAFLLAHLWWPGISESIYQRMPQLLATLNIVALLLCLYLWWNGRMNRSNDPLLTQRMPFVFEFYRGMELHPRLLDMDVKQLVNSRIGLMMWQLLTLAFLVTSHQRHGYNLGTAVNVGVQLAYLAKFYWWETGYFTTMDVTVDRPGFYISWGHLNFVPSFYTFSTYYLVQHPPIDTSDVINWACLALGLGCVYMNYAVDRQKELFVLQGRRSSVEEARRCVGGRYRGREVRLLVSGYWAVARHLNYVFELVLALCWNMPAWGLGSLAPFLYNLYLLPLLVHRIYRDEDKCKDKYGPYWDAYCRMVPYRLVPYVY